MINNFDSLQSPIPESTSKIDDSSTITPSKAKRIMTAVGWTFLGLFCLIFFTLLKLPEDRLKNYIDGSISAVLAPRGISLTSTDSSLSFIFGLSYTMKDVTLNFPPPAAPAHIDRLQVSPSILPLIIGRMGGAFKIKNGDGTLNGSFSMKKTNFSFSFRAKKFDLGKVGALPLAAKIQGSMILDGTGSLSGDMMSPVTLDGGTEIKLSKIVIDPQMVMGFSVPRLNVSEGTIDVAFDKAKAAIKTFRFGKQGNPSDDIQATITGDITLGKTWDASQLNVKTHFSLSPSILKAFSLLDAILGMGKQADESYAFNLNGPLLSPMPTPIGANGGN